MTEKVPKLSRGDPITAEYLNALARAVNAGQIVLPSTVTGGAAISSPSGPGSSPPVSDDRTWTITSVTDIGGVADTLTMTDGLGSTWTISNLGLLCALCGGGGGGGTNYVMAVTVSETWSWSMVFVQSISCSPPPGIYSVYQLRPSLTRSVIWCQNGTVDSAVYTGAYIKLLNGGSPVSGWNFTTGATRTLYTWPNIPSDIPDPSVCTIPTYLTMTRFSMGSSITANCTLYPSFQTIAAFDQLQILASDNATVIWDLDLSGTRCQNEVTGFLPATTSAGNAWTACGEYYVIQTAGACVPATPVEIASNLMAHRFRQSWILAAPP